MDTGDLGTLGHTKTGTETQGKWVTGLALRSHNPLTGMNMSWYQSLPQDDQGWPPVNSTARPWRSAPPSPPPPGTRHTGTPPTLEALDPITQATPALVHYHTCWPAGP